LRAFDRLGHLAQQFLQVLVPIDEVDVGCVHDQQIRRSVVKKEVFVGFHYFFQIFVAHGALAGSILFLEALFQHLGRGLQVDHEIGRGQLRAEVVVVTIVGIQFLIGEVETGEEFVLFEDVIGDDGFMGARSDVKRLQLLKALHQKCELRLKRRASLAFVKRAEKRIGLGLHHALRIEALRQNPGKRAFADSDGTFYRNVPGQLEEISHGLAIIRNLQDSSDTAQWQLREELTEEIGQFENFRMVCSIANSLNYRMHYNPCMLALALTGAVSATAALSAGYQSMAPTAQWYGRTFTGLGRGSRQIALTYDDGPNDAHTLRLLEVLARHDVHATFFVMGRYVRQHSEIAREVVQAGHVVGNHTFTHPMLSLKSEVEIRRELSDCHAALQDAIGEPSKLFRPPFGARRPAVLRIVRELGMQPVMWNVTGYDWTAPPAAAIEGKVMKQVRGGDVILLHDGGHKEMGADRSQTVIATDRLITRYKDEGREFVTISTMLRGEAGLDSGV